MNRSQYYIMQKKHEDYLMHHGIDGQKWGVKHGPPYPLDDSKSTGSRLKTKKKKKKKELDPGEKAAIERGAHKGRWGGLVGSLVGATVADIKYKRSKKKESQENKKPEQTWTEETRKTIPKKREDNMRRLATKYLKEKCSSWDDGSELKFLSERVITEKDGSKTTETMFSNNNALITVETNYDTNGKVTSRNYTLDD